jgi:DNA-binding response OmpR family regulator
MRLLVIEDEPKLQKVLRKGLAEEGFSVDVASDGEQGLSHARSGRHDAIVLDLMIPKVPGLEVLATLRREKVPTPVLILTARDGPEEKVAGLDRGADDYLTKPFALSELVARLRAVIRRANGVTSSEIRVGDLEIDTAGRRVSRAGRPIELRGKEYALLELLALNRGKVLTHSQIHEHLYDSNSELLSNVIDVHVCRLRSRIDRGFPVSLIRTIRGQGYVLKEP